MAQAARTLGRAARRMGDLNPRWRYLPFSGVSKGGLSLCWNGEHVVDSNCPALEVIRDFAFSQLALVVGKTIHLAVGGVCGHALGVWIQDLLIRQLWGMDLGARAWDIREGRHRGLTEGVHGTRREF